MEGANAFFIAAASKELKLKKLGLNLSIVSFLKNGENIEIVLSGKQEKRFTVSFQGKSAFLENPEERTKGGRPTFPVEDMVTYLFLLTNGGPVQGILMYPGAEDMRFMSVPAVFPT